MDRMTPKERARFDSKVIQQGNCLVMASPLDPDGYATFWFRSTNRRAHRVAYWAKVGDIPAGMYVDHICGNRACVNHDHLRALTPAENSRRSRPDTCKHGHPFDREYSGQRYCSICAAAKSKRLRAKWREEGRTSVAGL